MPRLHAFMLSYMLSANSRAAALAMRAGYLRKLRVLCVAAVR